MLDIIFFIGATALLLLLFYIGTREDSDIPEFRLIAGLLILILGIFILTQGIGSETTTIITQTEMNVTDTTVSRINSTTTTSYEIPEDLSKAFGIFYVLLGFYLTAAQVIAYIPRR